MSGTTAQSNHSPSNPLTTSSPIVVVGAGVFGLSTAFHLLARGYTNVTVLDRAVHLPAVDAASTDMNKIVRSCYTDMFYTQLAKEAIDTWKSPMWKDCYHACGVISISSGHLDSVSKENDRRLGTIKDLSDTKAIRTRLIQSLHPSTDLGVNDHRIGPLTGYSGYLNPEGGWVEATRAIDILLSHVREMGGNIIANKEVTRLIRDTSGRTTGVECTDSAHFKGDRIILTIGPWTTSTFPELHLDSLCLATGHTVGMIQLTTQEMERYKDIPVFLNFDSGLYVFPPNQDGIVKLAMHMAGHTHMIPRGDVPREISTPRTVTSHPDAGDGLRVPRSALQMLRTQLNRAFPELAEKPWAGTRLCWYTDAPDGNWVIGSYPGDPTLFLATSGSGHGFKFLPNLGRLVVDALEGVLDPAIAARFAVDREVVGAMNGERASTETIELDVAELCGPEEGV